MHDCPCPCSFSYLSIKDELLTFGPPLHLRQRLLLVSVATYLGVKSEARETYYSEEDEDELVRARVCGLRELPRTAAGACPVKEHIGGSIQPCRAP